MFFFPLDMPQRIAPGLICEVEASHGLILSQDAHYLRAEFYSCYLLLVLLLTLYPNFITVISNDNDDNNYSS